MQHILHTWTDFSFQSFKRFEEIENQKQRQFNSIVQLDLAAENELHSLFKEAVNDFETSSDAFEERRHETETNLHRKNNRQISGTQLTNLIEDQSPIAHEPKKYAFIEFVPDKEYYHTQRIKRKAAFKAVTALKNIAEGCNDLNFNHVDFTNFRDGVSDSNFERSIRQKIDPIELGFREVTQFTRAKNKLMTDSEFDADVRTLKDVPEMPDFIVREIKRKPVYQDRYRCQICKVTFKKSWITHMFQCHDHLAPFTCNQASCHYQSGRKSLMKYHLWDIHGIRCGADPVYRCSKCPKNESRLYMNPASMKSHSIMHLPSKDFLCTQCESKFRCKGGLSEHVTQVHGKLLWSCEKCPCIFTTESRLRKHVLNTHEAVRNWKCGHCDHAAVQRYNCLIHIRGKHKGKQELVIDLNLPNAFR